tara:strand:- start:170 stop:829 length:660 start_codon:yes stop_codon:yes gene_type:complete
MKKLITAIFGFALISFSADAVERKIGFTAALTDFESSGTETMKSNSDKTSTDISETVIVPSLFLEISTDAGLGIGIDYVPVDAEIGNKSKTKVDIDTDDAADNGGTNKASADVSGHSTIYLKIPVKAAFLKVGYVEADIETTENLATGTTYGNKSVNGTMVSLGFDRDLENGTFIRAEVAYTDYDDITLTGSADTDGVSNKVDADVDATALRISVGKAF